MATRKQKTAEVVRVEPETAVVPLTGEVVLRTDVVACARVLREIKETEAGLRTLKRWLTDALIEERERTAAPVLFVPGIGKVEFKGGNEYDWDVEILAELPEAGLPAERYDALVSEVVETKVNATVAGQIEKLNPVYAAIIQRARTTRPKSITAEVKRS